VQPSQLASEMGNGLVIDAREPEAFAAGHIPKSLSIWALGLPVFGGWIAGPRTPVFLILPEMKGLQDAVLSLARIGVDNVAGVLAGGFSRWRDEGMPVDRSGTVTPRELERTMDGWRVLDVREDLEFEEEGHIPRAAHLYVGYLDEHLRKIEPPLDKSERVAVTSL
jgi:hydroxyacylglutathione hydrolase